MHHYLRNSPDSSARILAVAMVADGHVCDSEMTAALGAGLESRLGLAPAALPGVLQTLCEDLAQSSAHATALSAAVDGPMIESLLRDVDDPRLQRELASLVAITAAADGHVSDGEQRILAAMRQCWGLDRAPVAEAAGTALERRERAIPLLRLPAPRSGEGIVERSGPNGCGACEPPRPCVQTDRAASKI